MERKQDTGAEPQQLKSQVAVQSKTAPPPSGSGVPTIVHKMEQSDLNRMKKEIIKALNSLVTELSGTFKDLGPGLKQQQKDTSPQGRQLAETMKQHRQGIAHARDSAKGYANAGKGSKWVDEMAELICNAIAHESQDEMKEFVGRLKKDVGFEMPETGAFWSGKDTGQTAARTFLKQTQSGLVLADTYLGKAAAKTNIAPQGVNIKSQESVDDFAKRNKVALMFWGAVSSAYADCLKGDVHIYLPKGITMGSMFWNDELPVLWERKRANEINELYFHLNTETGWSPAKRFEEIAITEVYGADRTGVHKGAMQLEGEGLAKVDPTDYSIALKKPLNIGWLKTGLNNWKDRAMANKEKREKPAE